MQTEAGHCLTVTGVEDSRAGRPSYRLLACATEVDLKCVLVKIVCHCRVTKNLEILQTIVCTLVQSQSLLALAGIAKILAYAAEHLSVSYHLTSPSPSFAFKFLKIR